MEERDSEDGRMEEGDREDEMMKENGEQRKRRGREQWNRIEGEDGRKPAH